RKLHRDPTGRRKTAMIVRQRASQAAKHPGKRNRVRYDVQPAQSFEQGEPAKATVEQTTQKTAADASQRSYAQAGPEDSRGIGQESGEILHYGLSNVSAEHAAHKDPETKAEHLFRRNSHPVGADHHGAAAHQHRHHHQRPKSVDFDRTEMEHRLRKIRNHAKNPKISGRSL